MVAGRLTQPCERDGADGVGPLERDDAGQAAGERGDPERGLRVSDGGEVGVRARVDLTNRGGSARGSRLPTGHHPLTLGLTCQALLDLADRGEVLGELLALCGSPTSVGLFVDVLKLGFGEVEDRLAAIEEVVLDLHGVARDVAEQAPVHGRRGVIGVNVVTVLVDHARLDVRAPLARHDAEFDGGEDRVLTDGGGDVLIDARRAVAREHRAHSAFVVRGVEELQAAKDEQIILARGQRLHDGARREVQRPRGRRRPQSIWDRPVGCGHDEQISRGFGRVGQALAPQERGRQGACAQGLDEAATAEAFGSHRVSPRVCVVSLVRGYR